MIGTWLQIRRCGFDMLAADVRGGHSRGNRHVPGACLAAFHRASLSQVRSSSLVPSVRLRSFHSSSDGVLLVPADRHIGNEREMMDIVGYTARSS